MLQFEKFKHNNLTDWAAVLVTDPKLSSRLTHEAVNTEVICLQGVVRKQQSGWQVYGDRHKHTSASAVDV